MNKKSTLQSGFLKLRVSLSLLLFSAGVFLALLGSGLFAVAEEQQAPLKNFGVQFGQSYHNDVSPALRDLAVLWPAPGTKDKEAWEANLNPKLPLPLHKDVPDPVVEPSSVLKTLLAEITSPVLNSNRIPNPGIGYNGAPPDTNGTVGLTQYLQVMNGGYQVFNKATGAPILGPTAIQAIWSGFGGVCQSSGNGDPVVLYDHLANRWLISQFARASITTDQCIAISTNSDATGTYNRYAFHLGSNFFDYPHVGVWPDGYYMSTNVFDASRTLSFGPQAFALDRAKMLAGLPATFVTPGITGGGSEPSFLPGDLDGSITPPLGTANPFVSFPGTGVYNVRLFHVDFVTPGNTTFNLIGTPAAAGFTQLCPSTPACVPQLDATVKLDAIGDRLMSRLAYRKFADGHEAIVGNYTVSAGGVAGLRWFELRAVTTAPVVFQESTYQPDMTWRWMGSAAMDQNGDLAIGFSASSATITPLIRYAGRLVTDPINTLGQGEATLFSRMGGQIGTSNRWGDYSLLTVDPADDCTFWYTQEYYSTTGSSNGRARIGSFKFPTCSAAPAATPPATPIATSIPPGAPAATATATATIAPTPSPTPGPFASDPFDDSSSVNITSRPMVTGQTWAAASSWSGTFLTTGTGNAYSTASNKMDVITTDASAADYTVSANVTYITFNDWDIGVVGRGNAAGSNCYLATVLVNNSGASQTLRLSQIAGGTFTSLGTYALTGSDLLTPGSIALIELVMNGSSISVRWKGTQRIAVTNTVFTAAGRAGIWAGLATSSTGPQFKDFNATLAGSSSPTPTSTPSSSLTPTATPTATVCGTTSTFSNTTPITIPDSGPAVPYPSTVTVAGAGTILATPGSVWVTINNFSHTFPDDVGILLVGPTGAALLLQDGAGDGVPIVNVTYTLSDTGATQLPDTGVWGPGTYKPATYYLGANFPPPGPGTVYGNPGPAGGGTATFASIFGGTNANGTWSLYVVDLVSGLSGAIAGGWSLTVTTNIGCPTPTPTPSPTPTATICGTISTVSNTAPITIADAGNASPYPSTVTIAGAGSILTTPGSVRVTINNFSHTFPDDVGIVLVGPTGATLLLQDGAGDGTDMNNVTYTISDTGAMQLPDTGAWGPGTYKPAAYYTGGNFPPPGPGTTYGNPGPAGGGTATFTSVFGGTSANGVWSLYVEDFVAGESGIIAGGWTLTITTDLGCPTPTPTPTATVCGPGGTFSNTAPITIPDFGNGVPYPSTITVAGVGTIPATAGSVQVAINSFSHTFPGDVGIVLVGPTGATFLLQDGAGNEPMTNITYTFNDTGATILPKTGSWGMGTYKPTSYYSGDIFPAPGPGAAYNNPGPAGGGTATFTSVFGGTNANGVWSLYVEDFVAGESGSIAGGWSLTITVPPCGTPTPPPTPTPTPSASPTPAQVSISGTVLYCSNPVPGPVPNVTLTLTGPTSGSTLSDGSGNYSFTGLPSGGNYTVTPSKAARTPGSANINTVDVIAVQKQFLTGTFLTGCRLTAADVNGDSVVNTQDVIAVQRFFNGFTNAIANVGKYQFTPASRTYTGITTNQTAQNYDTLVFGDVSSPFVEPAPTSTPTPTPTATASPTPTSTATPATPTPTPTPATPTPTPSPSPTPTATATPTSTPATVSISGTVSYCTNPVPGPVPNATLTLTGTTSGSTMSDAFGNYSFTGLPSGGSYVVTPSKGAIPPGTGNINTVDVIGVQKQFLTGTFLTGCKLAAADVNGDTVVNTQDVIAVQRFFSGFTNAIANVGKYKFMPANRTYTGITTNQTAQDYDTLVFGDVASPYSELPDSPSQTAPDNGTSAGELPPAVAAIALPEVALDGAKSNFIAAVRTSAIDANNKLVGFQGDFTFDERVVRFQSPPVQNAGLTAGNWNVLGNVLPGPGPIRALRISAYSNDFTPLSGSGTFLELRMTRVSKATHSTPLVWAAPPNQFIFIDADLKTQKPGNAAPGSVTPSGKRR